MADDDRLSISLSQPSASMPRRSRRIAMPMGGGGEFIGAPANSGDRALWVGRLLVGLLSLVLLALLGRAAQLQHDPHPQIAARIDSQRSTRALLARRGGLVDRRGRALATTRVARRLFVDPALIEDHNTFSEHVGYTLGYNPAWIARTLAEREPSRYIVLDPRLEDERLAKLENFDLPGLATEPVLVRDYPQGRLAGHLVGFVGHDGQGLEGLEKHFDRQLQGTAGRVEYLRDARRRPLWIQANDYHAHENGQSVRLSLDVTIQAIAEKHLAQTVTRYGAESGQLIVMQPHTGEILALANYPSFDPGAFRHSTADQRRNRAVTDVFEPGSIFKPFVWAAATQLDAATPEEIIDCTTSGVYVSPKGRRLRDAHGQGELSWEQVLTQSSNIGMAIVAQRIEHETLRDVVRSFGFGEPTGSGLPGEIGGIITPMKRWNHYSQTSVPMGQEIGTTALQMTRAFCVIANDGVLVQPTIHAITGNNAEATIHQRVLRPEIARLTRQVLRQAVTDGTGRKADSKHYALFGKTGTAQLPNFETGGYHQDQYVSSFVAGAPVQSPRLVIGCFIQKPDRAKGHYGGIVAAPAVMKVMEQSLLYLGVAPEQTSEQPLSMLTLNDALDD